MAPPRLAWQLSRATLVIFIAVIATVTGALLWASWESDEVSVQRQERIARHAFGVALDELALQQEAVAVWDEAAARLVASR